MSAVDSKVEIEFTPGVWTDVSSWVESWENQCGRSYEFDEVEAGTASFTLNNSDGRFTPGRPASPYYPNIKPRRKVRMSMSTNGGSSWTVMFYGAIENWPVTVEQGTSSVAVTATDALGILGRKRFDRPYLHELILGCKPKWYWPLNDPTGSTEAKSVTAEGAVLRATAGGITAESGYLGGPGLMVTGELDRGGSWVCDRGAVPHYALPDEATVSPRLELQEDFPTIGGTGQAWGLFATVDLSGRVLEPSGGGLTEFTHHILTVYDIAGNVILDVYLYQYNNGSNQPWQLRIDSPYLASSPAIKASSATLATTFVAVSYNPASSPDLRVMFNYAGSYSSFVWTPGTSVTGKKVRVGWNAGVGQGSVALSNLAIWGGSSEPFDMANGVGFAETKAKILGDMALIGRDGGGSRVAATVATDLLRICGMYTGTALSAGSDLVTMPEPAIGDSVSDLLRLVFDSTGGSFAADTTAFTVKGVTRGDRMGNYASGFWNLSDSTGSSPEPGLVFNIDENRIANRWTVTRNEGGTFSAEDAASVAEFGPLGREIQSIIASDVIAQGQAEWNVHIGSQPRVRCDSVEVDLTPSTLDPTWLTGFTPGLTPLMLSELPDAAPYSSAKFIIEGWSLRGEITGEVSHWSVSLNLSPATPWQTWKLQDASLGQLDNPDIVLSY